PQPRMAPGERFKSLVDEHFGECFFWTKASLLYLIGQHPDDGWLEIVQRAMHDSEPIVRETASWALAYLNPPDLRRTLLSQADDPNESVRDVIAALLATFAPRPSPQEP
ncbi:MAG TPA: HEAT repeat domain-containing protein, partial [Pseudomonadales bacterium]|nr:HEAT repeat domain-containing protein [Pseudomonadales bacterium]